MHVPQRTPRRFTQLAKEMDKVKIPLSIGEIQQPSGQQAALRNSSQDPLDISACANRSDWNFVILKSRENHILMPIVVVWSLPNLGPLPAQKGDNIWI